MASDQTTLEQSNEEHRMKFLHLAMNYLIQRPNDEDCPVALAKHMERYVAGATEPKSYENIIVMDKYTR